MRFDIVGTLLLLTSLIVACGYFRISRPGDAMAYIGMARECHPVWKKLALRQVNAGDSAADFLASNTPTIRVEFGRYGAYRFAPGEDQGYLSFTGLSVIASDGKLIRAEAWSCTWNHTFFDEPDPEFDPAYQAYVEKKFKLQLEKAEEEIEPET